MPQTKKTKNEGAAIGRRLARLAKLAGLTHRDLAALTGVSRSAPGALFRGEIPHPQITTIAPLARVLGAPWDWLVSGEGEPPTKEQVLSAVERARASKEAA